MAQIMSTTSTRRRRRTGVVSEAAASVEPPSHRTAERPAVDVRSCAATGPSDEVDRLVRILQERYPDVGSETLSSLIEQAHAELAAARIQSYRMVLTERAVRRRLTSEPRTPEHNPDDRKPRT
jgi:hypothetical protein